MKKLLLILLLPYGLNGMRQENNLDEARSKIKDIVQKALEKKEKQFEHGGVAVAGPALVKTEVASGAILVENEQEGIMCTDGKVIFVDYKIGMITKQLQMQSGLELAHKANPAIVALAAMKHMFGAEHKNILMGEDKGRILILDPEVRQFKTLGEVPGRILSFACNSAGNQIGVIYTGKNSSDLPVPCFALSVAFVKTKLEPKVNANKRRSWHSVNLWDWTPFLTKQCEHQVDAITFDDTHCITECATGYLEKWLIINPETNPQLMLLSKVQKPNA